MQVFGHLVIGLVVVFLGVVGAAVVVVVVGFGVVVFGFLVGAGGFSSNNSQRVKIFFGAKFFLLGNTSGIRCSSISSHCAMPCHTAWMTKYESASLCIHFSMWHKKKNENKVPPRALSVSRGRCGRPAGCVPHVSGSETLQALGLRGFLRQGQSSFLYGQTRMCQRNDWWSQNFNEERAQSNMDSTRLQ